MSRNLVLYVSNFLQRLESLLPAIFPRGSMPPASGMYKKKYTNTIQPNYPCYMF